MTRSDSLDGWRVIRGRERKTQATYAWHKAPGTSGPRRVSKRAQPPHPLLMARYDANVSADSATS